MKICNFRNQYYFLSNFYPCKVEYNGLVFRNSEAAFQSMKCLDINLRKNFCNLEPNIAKSKGRHVKLRNDWEDVKDQFMYEIVKAKFEQNITLKKYLMNTGNAYLEEGNTWGDTEWGVCRGKGENKLGKILMKVRYEFLYQ